MYESRWDGDTLRIWDCEKRVPVCAVYLAKDPKKRMKMAHIIAEALNKNFAEASPTRMRISV